MSRRRADPERTVRRLFRVSLYLKATNAVVELVAGGAIYLVSNAMILSLAQALTRHALLEHPDDVVANFLLRSAEALSIGGRSAAALYLFSHGAIKLVLVVLVIRDRLWAYPLFMIALAALIAYQSYQLTLGFSPWLAALTVFDVAILLLTGHEYRLHRRDVV